MSAPERGGRPPQSQPTDRSILDSILAGADPTRRQILGDPDGPQTVTIALAKAGALDDIARLLPAGSRTQASRFLAGFIRCARLDLQNGKGKLLKCSLASILEALKMAASVDVVPGDGRAYLIPYGEECQFQLGVHGLRDVLRRSEDILDINDQVVREGDEFEAVLSGMGRGVRHVPADLGERGEIIGAYATITLRGVPEPLVELMDRAEIDQIKAQSKNTYSDGPWSKWFGEMARKAVLRRLAKRVPMRPDDAAALQAADAVGFLAVEAATEGQRAIRNAPARATIDPAKIRASADANRGHDNAAAQPPTPPVAATPEPEPAVQPKRTPLAMAHFDAAERQLIAAYLADTRGLDSVPECEQWLAKWTGTKDDLLEAARARMEGPDAARPPKLFGGK